MERTSTRPVSVESAPYFPGVSGELVERKPDGLRGSRPQAQLGAMHGDARTNKVGEMRELGVNSRAQAIARAQALHVL